MRTRQRSLALLLALFLLLSGCAQTSSASDPSAPLLYYAASEDSADYGSAALQSTPWNDAPLSPEIDDYVNQLLETPEDTRLRSVFPDDLRLLGWTLEDQLLTLDFSEEYSELSGISLTLANCCLTLTLTQLDGIEQVQVTVHGRSLPEGSEPLSAEDLLLTGETPDPVTIGFQLYFPLTDGGLGTEYQEAELSGTDLSDQIAAVILLLTQGPQQSSKMLPVFNDLESQLEYELLDGVCLLTLTENWAAALQDSQTRQALVNSLCELDGIDALAFNWENAGADGLSGTFQAVYD